MSSFAVMLRSRPGSLDGILVIVDERRAADEIAIELRLKGHAVDVEEFRGNPRPAERRADRVGSPTVG
jgi:hypothetical protein